MRPRCPNLVETIGMATVRDYPWSSLDAFRRADLDAIRGLRSLLRAHVDPRSALASLAAQTKARIDVRFRRSIVEVPQLAPGDIGLLLAPADAPDTTHAVFVAVEGLLATTLVARALEQKPPRIADASAAPSPAIAGAFAALVVRAARRDASTPLRVLAAGSAATFARDLASAAGSFVGASFTALVDDDAFLAHVLVARARASSVAAPEWTRESLRRAGALPIAIPVVAKTFSLSAADVASLRVGDALLVPDWNDGPEVALAPAHAELGVTAVLESPTKLVLRGESQSLPWSDPGEEAMTDRDPLVEAVGEVPVVVRVEVGSVELSARQWSELAPGDVLTVGRRVRDPVSIRASGVEIARGELVEVDGEVGVRIVSLTKERVS